MITCNPCGFSYSFRPWAELIFKRAGNCVRITIVDNFLFFPLISGCVAITIGLCRDGVADSFLIFAIYRDYNFRLQIARWVRVLNAHGACRCRQRGMRLVFEEFQAFNDCLRCMLCFGVFRKSDHWTYFLEILFDYFLRKLQLVFRFNLIFIVFFGIHAYFYQWKSIELLVLCK